jgi:hypothetical protein
MKPINENKFKYIPTETLVRIIECPHGRIKDYSHEYFTDEMARVLWKRSERDSEARLKIQATSLEAYETWLDAQGVPSLDSIPECNEHLIPVMSNEIMRHSYESANYRDGLPF